MLAEIFMLRLETAMRAAKEPAVKEAVANGWRFVPIHVAHEDPSVAEPIRRSRLPLTRPLKQGRLRLAISDDAIQ